MLNGIVSHQDWLPTLLAAAGEPDIKGKLLKGHKAGGRTFKVHIDGFNMLPYLTAEVNESPRESFFYVNDDAQLVALRFKDWKLVFMEQRAKTMALWAEPFVPLRVPKLFNLRRDPFERADENSNTYWDWVIEPRLPDDSGAGVCGASDQVVKGVPTQAEAGIVQSGPSA